MSRLPLLLCSIAVAAVLLTGCGEKDDEATATTETTQAAASSSTATTSPTGTTASSGSVSSTSVAPSNETSHLVAVRVSAEGNKDRVTFEYDKGLPGYSAGYVPQVFADAEGSPVAVNGQSILAVVMANASTANLDSGQYINSYNGPNRFTPPGTKYVTEVVRTGDFEARLSWAIGTNSKQPYVISTAGSPSRVIVDIG